MAAGKEEVTAGKSRICRSCVGHRWEARTDGHRVSFFLVEPGFDWIVQDRE